MMPSLLATLCIIKTFILGNWTVMRLRQLFVPALCEILEIDTYF